MGNVAAHGAIEWRSLLILDGLKSSFVMALTGSQKRVLIKPDLASKYKIGRKNHNHFGKIISKPALFAPSLSCISAETFLSNHMFMTVRPKAICRTMNELTAKKKMLVSSTYRELA